MFFETFRILAVSNLGDLFGIPLLDLSQESGTQEALPRWKFPQWDVAGSPVASAHRLSAAWSLHPP